MIPLSDRRIKRRTIPDLQADEAEYRVILDDMVRNGGRLIPDPNWLRTEDTSQRAESYDREEALAFSLSQRHFRAKVHRMENLMVAWVGGTELPSEHVISKYYHFLQHCDALGLWRANMEEPAAGAGPLLRADLGTLMDLNLLYAFSSSSDRQVTAVLEVGGGYGRLAEAMFNIFGRTVQYVMVDAVPASLYYARKYLACACPEARILSYYDSGVERGGPFEMSRHDIAILPAWHFERLNRMRYDICINIESMQEMNQDHVDHYLGLFQSVAAEDATIYLSNAHDYYFRGSFNYPGNWQKLFCANTPRSWRSNHPTEIFRKTRRNCGLQNRVGDALHEYRCWLESGSEKPVKRAPSLKKSLGRAVSSIRDAAAALKELPG